MENGVIQYRTMEPFGPKHSTKGKTSYNKAGKLNNMKSTGHIKNASRYAILLLLAITSAQLFGQGNKGLVDSRDQAQGWYLPVFGQVFENGEKCQDATVIVYLENDELGSFPTSKKGAFRLELDLDNYYTIEIHKEGALTKRISVDTHMDKGIVNYPAYDCFVNLSSVDAAEGADMDYFDFPAAIVRYDAEQGGFYHSDHYLAHISNKIDHALQQASASR